MRGQSGGRIAQLHPLADGRQRILSPQVRLNGAPVPAGWDVAIEHAVRGLMAALLPTGCRWHTHRHAAGAGRVRAVPPDHQLGPELLDVVAGYDRVVFVDAHVRPDAPDIGVEPVAAEYATAPFTHHMTPAMLLALLVALYGARPDAYLVSVRGHAFDFERGLTPATAVLVEPAVQAIIGLV